MPEAQTSPARKIERLRRQANEMRRRNLRMIHEAGMGHTGGASTDPDGDAVGYIWWRYAEADTYEGEIALHNADQAEASFTVPEDAPARATIHIILEATDAGSPPLTRYRRVVVTVAEAS